MEFIIKHISWVFSGIGVFFLGLFFYKRNKKRRYQKQKVSNRSIGIQAGGNVTISERDNNESKSNK